MQAQLPVPDVSRQDKIDQVRKSFGRCQIDDSFIARFYEIFLASNPDVPARFAQTDFVIQRAMLRDGLTLMVMYACKNPMGEFGMQRLRRQHGPDDLDIPAPLYDRWLDSLIQAVARTDPEYTEMLGLVWREVMVKGVRYIQGLDP